MTVRHYLFGWYVYNLYICCIIVLYLFIKTNANEKEINRIRKS